MVEEKQLLTDIGNRLAKRRKELHLTQEQVAFKINLSLQSVSCIELGKKAIRLENLLRMCSALDLSPNYVLTGKKSSDQVDGILKKLSLLSDTDYAFVEACVDHLLSR